MGFLYSLGLADDPELEKEIVIILEKMEQKEKGNRIEIYNQMFKGTEEQVKPVNPVVIKPEINIKNEMKQLKPKFKKKEEKKPAPTEINIILPRDDNTATVFAEPTEYVVNNEQVDAVFGQKIQDTDMLLSWKKDKNFYMRLAKPIDIYTILKYGKKTMPDSSMLVLLEYPSKTVVGKAKQMYSGKKCVVQYDIPFVEKQKGFVKMFHTDAAAENTVLTSAILA